MFSRIETMVFNSQKYSKRYIIGCKQIHFVFLFLNMIDTGDLPKPAQEEILKVVVNDPICKPVEASNPKIRPLTMFLDQDYQEYRIPNPTSEEMERYAIEKIAEWGKLATSENFYWAPKNYPVHRAIAAYIEGFGRDQLIGAIRDNRKEAAEIQVVSQWLARKEFGDSIELYPQKVYRGFGRGVPIERARLFPYDSYTTDISVARNFAQEAFGVDEYIGIRGTGYIIELELPVENIFTYYNAHPSFKKDGGRILRQKEVLANAKDGIGARLTNLYRHDGTRASAEEIEALKKANPEWFSEKSLSDDEILKLRELSAAIERARYAFHSWESELQAAQEKGDEEYIDFVTKRYNGAKEWWDGVKKQALLGAPHLLTSDELELMRIMDRNKIRKIEETVA